MSKFKAHAYDYDLDKVVYWESDNSHCSSCAWDESYGGFIDDPCCCAHNLEYLTIKEESTMSRVKQEADSTYATSA